MPTLNSLFWLILIVISIELGFISYLINWNSNLDFITMLILLMNIVFSTNCIIHVSCAYFESIYFSTKKKIRNTLFTIGLPLTQSYLLKFLTIASITFASPTSSLSSISYIYLTFAKSALILIGLGVYHELFLLPVLLSLSNSLCKKPIYSNEKHDLSDLELDDQESEDDFYYRKSHKSYYKCNRERFSEQPPFYYTEKWFDGKQLTVNRCATVTIPRLVMKQPKSNDKLNDNINFLTGNRLNAINARAASSDQQQKNQQAWNNHEDMRIDVIQKFNEHWKHLNDGFRLNSKDHLAKDFLKQQTG